jgi:two-component system chemotaxis response regulator CheY
VSATAKTCLVVDDSRAIRAVARSILEQLGFTVEEAKDGEEALATCRRRMPDMLLLDRNMPRLDGIGCVRALRTLPDGRRPKVIFCTSESSVDGMIDAIAAGADEYIMKPFDREIIELKMALVGVL